MQLHIMDVSRVCETKTDYFMKRRLFFFIEKLSITPGERKTMAVLISLILILTTVQFVIPQQQAYTSESYSEIIQEFNLLSAAFLEEEREILARYEPSSEQLNNNSDETSFTEHAAGAQTVTELQQSVSKDTLVHINKAKAVDFERLPGIGPAIANNIVRFREENGQFESIDDLLNVRGIGEARLESIRQYLTLE